MATRSRSETLATIKYYLRLELYGHVVAETSGKAFDADSEVLFWKAFSNGMLGNVKDSVCDFDYLRHRYRSLEYPVHVALEHFKYKEDDRMFESSANLSRSVTDEGLYLTAAFHLYVRNFTEADKCIQRVLSIPEERRSVSLLSVLALRGWIALHFDSRAEGTICQEIFEQVQSIPDRFNDTDVLMLLAAYLRAQGRYDAAAKRTKEDVVPPTLVVPALIEEAKLELLSCNFEGAVESSKRLIEAGKDNAEALWTCFVIEILCTGSTSLAAEIFQQLSTCIATKEATNGMLFCRLSTLLARLPSQDTALIQASHKMIRKACEIDPSCALFQAELGFNDVLAKNYPAALSAYHQATKMVQSSTKAYRGIVHCYVLQDRLDEAAQQIDFLSIIDGQSETDPEVLYLQAILAFKKLNYQGHMDYLLRAATILLSGRRRTEQQYDALECYTDMELCIRVVKQILRYFYVPLKHIDGTFVPCNHLATRKSLELLQFVTSHAPSYAEGWNILAKVQLEQKQFDSVLRTIQSCKPCSATHLLRAQLATSQDRYEIADQHIKEALSCDFRIRDHALYKLLMSQVLSKRGLIDESCHILESEINIFRMDSYEENYDALVTKSDIVVIFEQYGMHMSKLNPSKAKEALRNAQQVFTGTTEELRMLKMLCKIYLEEGNVPVAVQMLDEMHADSLHYDDAQIAKAELFLEHRNDKNQYVKCFREIAQRKGTPEAYESLGDAYMKIQNPVNAVDAYNDALRLQPKANVHQKIGRALIVLRKFSDAAQHYENALCDMPGNSALSCDLANLYIKMRMLDKAGEILLREASGEDSTKMEMQQVNSASSLLFKLVDVYKLGGQEEKVRTTLVRLYSSQKSILASGFLSTSEARDAARKSLADICFEIGKCDEDLQNAAGANDYFSQALELNAMHERSMLALAKLHFRKNSLEKCELLCKQLRHTKSSDEAAMLLGDIKLQASDSGGAILEYTTVLQENPVHFNAIARFMLVLRIAGRLEDIAAGVLSRAERGCIDNNTSLHCGLAFCKGLYLRYSGREADAVIQFNLARCDSEWSLQSIYNMVELYLCDVRNWDDNDNIAAAQKLLQLATSSGKNDSKKATLLRCLCLAATKVEDNVQRAKTILSNMLQEDKQCVVALYGLSLVLSSEQEDDKARSILKRLAKLPYNPEHLEQFEFAYLTLAHYYFDSGKTTLALDLCKRCLAYNRSCLGALVMIADMAVSDGARRDASEYYQRAWAISNESFPSLGFKLAVNHMKLGRFVEAIDVCNKVQSKVSNYPLIKEKVLNICIMSLRP